MTKMTQAYEWQGRAVIGSDGEKIGKIKEIYEDQSTGQPEWAMLSGGLLGMKSQLVPLAGATPRGEDIGIPVTKDQIDNAPRVDPGGELSEAQEQRLFEHYGVPYTTHGSTPPQEAPRGAGASASGSGSGDAMTRSEEEVRVGTAPRERGRARLRKYVVTEEVQQTVPVQREEVRVEREPITDENVDATLSGPDISEAEHEVVLHEEEPVVEKRAVPKERVRLEKDTVTDERQVSEEVRKERIEHEGDPPR